MNGGYTGEWKTSLSRPVVVPAKTGIRMRDARYASD